MPYTVTKNLPVGMKMRRPLGVLLGADPWVVPHGGEYLLVQSGRRDTEIVIGRFADPALKRLLGTTTVWRADQTSGHGQLVWAPELHAAPSLPVRWYIYFTACDGDSLNHRMYALESESANPLGPSREKAKIAEPSDTYAIDQTVLHRDGRSYALWSGREHNVPRSDQNLYIAPMSNPWTISGARVCISRPSLPWERSVAWGINEGPQVLAHGERLFIVYSADASWSPAYKLGLLELTGTTVLNPSSWTKHPEPVFPSPATGRKPIGPGHACFIHVDGQDFMVYHRKLSRLAGWDRAISVRPFGWTPEGFPDFATGRTVS